MVRSLPRRRTLGATITTATVLALAPLSPAAAVLPAGSPAPAAVVPGGPSALLQKLQKAPQVTADVAVRPQGTPARIASTSSTPPQIAYSVAQAGSQTPSTATAVARLNPLTGVARTLAADRTRLLTAQAWSDDRFRVYYGLLDIQGAGAGTSNVDSVGQAGAPPRRERTGALSLDVSRDGTRLVYLKQEGAVANIFTSTAAGTDVRRITGAGALSARFSPDAGRIVFTRTVGAGEAAQPDVFTVRTNGTGLTRVTSRADTADLGGTFSPDGRRVLFTRFTETDDTPDIYVANLDGSGLRLVRANATAPDWASNGWLTYLVTAVDGDSFATQVAIRSPGGVETVLTRERNLVTAVRFAG